jgi:hypothetical protein
VRLKSHFASGHLHGAARRRIRYSLIAVIDTHCFAGSVSPDFSAIQLARTLTDLTVVATASRPETMSWVKDLGAHYVIDHGKPIAARITKKVTCSPRPRLFLKRVFEFRSSV